VLGVIDGTSVLIEPLPQSSASHSVAADCKRNTIFVPQVAPRSVVGVGGDTTSVGAGICGSMTGCVAVYIHELDEEDGENDRCQNEDHENDHQKKDR
jgi:hypothetical protein